MTTSRRTFLHHLLQSGLAVSMSPFILQLTSCARNKSKNIIVPEIKPEIVNLGSGVEFIKLSTTGTIMDDGLPVPLYPDGMGCFSAPDGGYILVRNHELSPEKNSQSPIQIFAYDSNCNGGTTTIILDQNLKVNNHFLSLTGTARNCSGGKTPWGTWLTCEETTLLPLELATIKTEGRDFLKKKHGYVFEVNPFDSVIKQATPLKSMGRFNHEACAVDESSGYIYMTEDRSDGCLYRFIPNTPGNLQMGGKLQALTLKSIFQQETIDLKPNIPYEIEWIDLITIDTNQDNVRNLAHIIGATKFNRGEGITSIDGTILFSCSFGGSQSLGQIFSIDTKDQTITLVFQATIENTIKNPDQMTINEWGDIIICEDKGVSKINRILGITPEGKVYSIIEAKGSEWTGVCFSPDMKILFANLQLEGATYALSVPWETLRLKAT